MKAFRLVVAVVVALLLATMSLASEAGVDGNDKKKDKKDDKDLMPVWVSAPEVKGKVSPQPAPNPPDPPKAPVDGNAVAAGYPQAVVPPPIPPPIMPPPLKNFRHDGDAQRVLDAATDSAV